MVASLVGRFACDGPDDLPRVRALQGQLTLSHLEPGIHPTGLPAPEAAVPGELRFFEQLRVWMADFPPSALTMYDTPDHHLVADAAGRRSIGDRTPGLVRADDGSPTLYVSRERPAGPARAAHWLPAPAGDSRPMHGLHGPGGPVLDGTYTIPGSERA